MNSLLGGLSNFMTTSTPAQTMPTQAAFNNFNQPNMLLQAMGAAMRGESPQEFMQKLAQTHPQLRQYDLNNLQQTAQQVCQEKGVNMQDAINRIESITSPLNK